jgi:hypothetical protein
MDVQLTKHLYRTDETVAALMISILRGRYKEAAFWGLELLDSGLVGALEEGLQTVWFYGFGVKAIGWICEFERALLKDAIDAGECIRLIVALAILSVRGKTDASMVALLGTGLCAEPERLWPYDFRSKEGSELLNYIGGACQQRKLASAWLAWNALPEKRIEDLEEILQWRHGDSTAWLSLFKGGSQQKAAMTLAAACLSKEEYLASVDQTLPAIPDDLSPLLEQWIAATGKHRSRRVFTVPFECLYHITKRGSEQTVYDSNEKELLGRLERPGRLWGSEFWDEAAEEFGGWEAVRSDDEARESFYNTLFPDDIPDEWPKELRAKSHGTGVLQRGQESSIGVWFKRWFGGLSSCLLWRGVEKAIRQGKFRGWKEDAWATSASTGSAEWDLRPVSSKRFEVATI